MDKDGERKLAVLEKPFSGRFMGYLISNVELKIYLEIMI